MTTRIQSAGPHPNVERDTSAVRVTPPPARPFRQVLDAGASAVVVGAESATRQLPGGPILAAAFRSRPATTVSERAAAPTPEGSRGSAGTADPSLPDGEATALAEGDQAYFYLELQKRISDESRAYTALSNVLKARHETVKNAIGNIR